MTMIDQAGKLRRHMTDQPRAKTLAIVSGKGGVGKSNTVLNFSIELQKRGKNVLLFDLDIGMGNIDILLGKKTNHTIADLFNDFMPIHDMIESGPKGLSYIAGGSSLNHLIDMDCYKLDYFFQQYELLTQVYDYIFFDMGAGVTETSLSLLLASDECIVVTTPEPTAITDAYSMIKQVVRRQQDMKLSLVMNRVESIKDGKSAAVRFQHVIQQFLGIEIELLGLLPNDKLVNTAVIRQIPYTILNERSVISKAMYQMTDVFLENQPSGNKQPDSFVQKLKRLLTVRDR